MQLVQFFAHHHGVGYGLLAAIVIMAAVSIWNLCAEPYRYRQERKQENVE